LSIVGPGIAIVLVKQLFGGLGQNFINPAIAARTILMLSWVGLLSGSAFASSASSATTSATSTVDAVTAATPLAMTGAPSFTLWQLFIGEVPGCIGEVSKLALLIGGVYLLLRGVISWRIPVTMIATVFFCSWIASGRLTGTIDSAMYQVLAGSLILGAFFMATDYATSPVTPLGRIIMGVGCGLLTFVTRRFNTNYPEGVSFAIMIMNLAVPLIDRFTKPRIYGSKSKGVKGHA